MDNAPAYMRWLPGHTTATLTRLELVARSVMEGFVSGRHKSPHKGFSVEFAEHRQYVPGDDLRDLDWRVLARKDRYYIKQYIEETNLRATILLDASGSMAYRGEQAAELDGRKLSKLEYAQYIAAVLSYLLIGQQDAVGMVTFDSKIRSYIPARSRASQVRTILEQIDATQPGNETALSDIFHDIAERIPRRGLVIILSDLFDNTETLLKALHHFRYRRHEVIVMHIMAEEELHFPFDSFTEFKDLESVRQLEVDPKTIRASYLDRVRRFLSDISAGCGEIRADYLPLSTKKPFDRALADYLARRKR
ncbi:MAG: DUF58 domain-containing protein [bacterium]